MWDYGGVGGGIGNATRPSPVASGGEKETTLPFGSPVLVAVKSFYHWNTVDQKYITLRDYLCITVSRVRVLAEICSFTGGK